METGLYIHIPFCAKKCPYCDFYSESYNFSTVREYTECLINSMEKYSGAKIDTIYFGGGTPSLLPANLIDKIMKSIYRNFIVSSECETTIEANPRTVSPEKLAALANSGINRISFGVQSCIDSELEFLGRNHTFSQAERSILDAENAGFKNISCDLMIGIRNQTAESLEYSIDRLSKLPVQHISAYMLKIEENTPFCCEEIIKNLPNEDTVSDFYLKVVDLLNDRGFSQYEISNFSKKGFESQHNLKYWRCEEYIGLGASAHSYFNGKRFFINPDISEYIRLNGNPCEIVTDEDAGGFEERAMLGLRLSEGLDLSLFPDKREHIIEKVRGMEDFVRINGSNISLTAKGFLMSNSVIGRIIF